MTSEPSSCPRFVVSVAAACSPAVGFNYSGQSGNADAHLSPSSGTHLFLHTFLSFFQIFFVLRVVTGGLLVVCWWCELINCVGLLIFPFSFDYFDKFFSISYHSMKEKIFFEQHILGFRDKSRGRAQRVFWFLNPLSHSFEFIHLQTFSKSRR